MASRGACVMLKKVIKMSLTRVILHHHYSLFTMMAVVQAAAASKGHLYGCSIVIFHVTLLTTILLHAAAAFSAPPITRIASSQKTQQLFSSQWEHDSLVQLDSVSTNPVSNSRSIARLEKFARLPVWPVWNGVFLFVVSKLLGQETAAKLEDAIGGRVCPNFFQSEQTSPFIMLVHHRHSFAPWDPLRYLQRSFFPRGVSCTPSSRVCDCHVHFKRWLYTSRLFGN